MLCKSYAGATGPVPILPQASSTLNQRAAFPGSPYFCSTPEQFRLTFAEFVWHLPNMWPASPTPKSLLRLMVPLAN